MPGALLLIRRQASHCQGEKSHVLSSRDAAALVYLVVAAGLNTALKKKQKQWGLESGSVELGETTGIWELGQGRQVAVSCG